MQQGWLHQRHFSIPFVSGQSIPHISHLSALEQASLHSQQKWVSVYSLIVSLLYQHHPLSQLGYQQEGMESLDSGVLFLVPTEKQFFAKIYNQVFPSGALHFCLLVLL